MRRVTLIAFGFVMLAAVTARPGMFPPEITYRIYIYGELAGKNVVKITDEGDAVVFESHSKVEIDDFALDLRCRTVVGRSDLRPRAFSYEGLRNGMEVSGSVRFDGESVTADHVAAGTEYSTKKNVEGKVALFENYMIEHQLLLLNTVARSDEPYQRFKLFFPIDFNPGSVLALLESEVELDTTPRSVCKKYHFEIERGSAFYGYIDLKRNLVVYMDFPATSTEIFLESAFTDTPGTKYVRPAAAP